MVLGLVILVVCAGGVLGVDLVLPGQDGFVCVDIIYYLRYVGDFEWFVCGRCLMWWLWWLAGFFRFGVL